ncbi:MAG: hypothetical protein AAGA48_28945 [Myxococcota bacterium]
MRVLKHFVVLMSCWACCLGFSGCFLLEEDNRLIRTTTEDTQAPPVSMPAGQAAACPSVLPAGAAVEFSDFNTKGLTEIELISSNVKTILSVGELTDRFDDRVALVLPTTLDEGPHRVLLRAGDQVVAETSIDVVKAYPLDVPPSPGTIVYAEPDGTLNFIPPLSEGLHVPKDTLNRPDEKGWSYFFLFEGSGQFFDCNVPTATQGSIELTETPGDPKAGTNNGYGTFDFGNNTIEIAIDRPSGRETYMGEFGNRDPVRPEDCKSSSGSCFGTMDIILKSLQTCRQLVITTEVECRL